jgi:hypothetical protein
VPVIDPRAFDAVLMLAFLAVAQVDIWAPWGDNGDQTVFEHRGVSSALMVVGIVPMLWRRRAPLVSAAALAAAMSVQVTLVYPTAAFVGAFVPMLVVTYSVAAYEERLDRALAGLTITVAGVLVVTLRIPELRSFSEVPFEIACLACAGWSAASSSACATGHGRRGGGPPTSKPSASARRARRSTASAPASPASCTTSSPTASA